MPASSAAGLITDPNNDKSGKREQSVARAVGRTNDRAVVGKRDVGSCRHPGEYPGKSPPSRRSSPRIITASQKHAFDLHAMTRGQQRQG
jgi:hypothetical protein